jgi:hypothetical protein
MCSDTLSWPWPEEATEDIRHTLVIMLLLKLKPALISYQLENTTSHE